MLTGDYQAKQKQHQREQDLTTFVIPTNNTTASNAGDDNIVGTSKEDDNIVQNDKETHLIAETTTGEKRVRIKTHDPPTNQEEEWEEKYGPRKRKGLRSRRSRSTIPQKFKDTGHMMFQ
eukprot:2341586-Ditylum_brightwellii.AAC.1